MDLLRLRRNGSVLNTLFIFQVEKELNDICNDILNVLDKHLIPCSDTGESKVFYYKMKGDYHRYLAEFATANERKEAAENSLVAYKAASDIALTELATTHPIRFPPIYLVGQIVFERQPGLCDFSDSNHKLRLSQPKKYTIQCVTPY